VFGSDLDCFCGCWIPLFYLFSRKLFFTYFVSLLLLRVLISYLFTGVRARCFQTKAPLRSSLIGPRIQPTIEACAREALCEMGVWHSEDTLAANFTCGLVWGFALCAVSSGASFQSKCSLKRVLVLSFANILEFVLIFLAFAALTFFALACVLHWGWF